MSARKIRVSWSSQASSVGLDSPFEIINKSNSKDKTYEERLYFAYLSVDMKITKVIKDGDISCDNEIGTIFKFIR